MIEEFVARGCEHLSYDVLIQIPKVGGKLVAEESFVDNVLCKRFVSECQCDKKTCIAYEHLVLFQVLRTP